MASFTPLYGKVASEEDLSGDSEQDYHETKRPEKKRRFRTSTILLSLTTLVFGAHSLYTLFHPTRCEISSFSQGYNTEWEPVKEAIELDLVTYGGAIRLNETSQEYYRDIDPTKPQYAGKPSKEIDQAWADLLHGQYLIISKEEAMKLDDPVTIEGSYLGEVEVMHSLHCLNAVRKGLNPDYYAMYDDHHSSPVLERVKDIHLDHCIEQLRQTIQCNGDLTPLLLRPFGKGDNQLLIGTPQVHTCRNWDKLRSWYTERGEKSGMISTQSV